MFNQVKAILLILSLAAGLIQPVVPLIEYYVFQEDIIDQFCENKNMPDMECNGMCYLTNKIEQQHDNQHEHSASLINVEQLPVFYLSLHGETIPLFPESQSDPVFQDAGHTASPAFGIFRPPRG